jgi:hypothetical protein
MRNSVEFISDSPAAGNMILGALRRLGSWPERPDKAPQLKYAGRLGIGIHAIGQGRPWGTRSFVGAELAGSAADVAFR